MPARIWLVMTPELPRAPISAPKLAAWATRSASASGPARSASSSAARTVASMFVPVSPSGHREHVERVDLVDVRLEAGDRAPERREEPGAVARPAGHQATSVPLPARSDGPRLVRRGRRLRDRGACPGSWRRCPIRIETRSGSRPSASTSA